MFKLFFKTITLILFLVVLILGLSIWKGGEPFRWIGDGTQAIGRSVSEFGDFVDDVISGGKELRKNYDKLKEVLTHEKEIKEVP